MPAPVTSSSSTRIVDKISSEKHRSNAQSRRKTRIVRRRGRAKHGIESDDEIIREVDTDSDTEDELSSLDSVSDSVTEPASEDVVANGRSRLLTPSTSHSPQSHTKVLPPRIDDNPPSFFATPATWGDMVMNENENAPSELPVIDFAEFDANNIPSGHASRSLSRRSKESDGSRNRSPRSETRKVKEDVDRRQPFTHSRRGSRSVPPKRIPGQSARQAYQQRLESDPSFVPTVGGFWGHDDRLLDKNLRSLSGWWRGRWQGRGRGRGFGMRGRGALNQAASQRQEPETNGVTTDLPPIERPWTHDGFEEMKRKEEHRRAAAQQQQANQTRGMRGGRGSPVVDRGGRGGMTRGGFLSSPTRPPTAIAKGRVWYAMKPELMWTKQHEAFLFFDASTKPRKGQEPSYRVRLPGTDVHVIRASFKSRHGDVILDWSVPNSKGFDSKENLYTVRIPTLQVAEKVAEPLTTVEEEEDIFVVRPNLVTVVPIPVPEPAASSSKPVNNPARLSENAQIGTPAKQSLLPEAEQLSVEADLAKLTNSEDALKKPAVEQAADISAATSSGDQRPTLPPLQTVFTPPPIAHPSPAYGTTYPYGPTLPPGVVLNAHGMPYELATGRPVFLAPPPMYTSRPILTPNALPFVPSHMHHSSISSDFIPSHTPPMNGFFDPSTGTPLFSLPRQTRIEIRAPTDETDGKGSRKSQSRQSSTKAPTLSANSSRSSESSNAAYYPYPPASDETNHAPPYPTSEARDDNVVNGDLNQSHADPQQMIQYPPFQPYYYPDSYGYYPYMEMTHLGQYDMYPSDPRGAQGTVYY
ncbi:hypothetical protein AMATHDRAFT_59421 [Amanita thiersii Skay4041]|uniref:Btz domain-containing protein n=1 Tax=Amanita thiersii Skay4041 TaxID=703135 RepID=A0A2A9NPV3_9AGAR|nr:hypothetical protein AMATHDRAFT_59421 [Amanita thiersii Skay4041]